jgi:hypothetical protein
MKGNLIGVTRVVLKIAAILCLVYLSLTAQNPADGQFMAATGIVLAVFVFRRNILSNLNISE